MAIDYSTPRGQVRALIPDVDETNPVLTDDLIDTYLVLSGNKVFAAAAMALEAIAVDEALVYKIVSTDDLSVNGVTGATMLLARAKTLRGQQEDADNADVGVFYLTTPGVLNKGPRRPEATPWPL